MVEEKAAGQIHIKTILVGTDFSHYSDRAMDYAVMLSEQFGATILILHIIESLAYSVTDSLTVIGHEQALSATATALLENSLKKLLDQGCTAESHLGHGTPYREIIKKAEEAGSDLVVIGTHGRTGMEHLLLGSVAEKVIRLATCPVLTVPSR